MALGIHQSSALPERGLAGDACVCVCVWGGGGVYAYCALLLIVVPCLTCLNCDYFITINVLVVSSLYHLHALLSFNTGNPFSQSQDAT